MHLVDLNVGADKGIHIELHPCLTVVEAGPKIQQRITALLGRAYVLAGTEVTGTIDGGGYLTPFDPTAVVALDLVGDGLDVIGPSDLLAPDPAPREAARLAAIAELERRQVEQETTAVERDKVVRLHDATLAALTAGSSERDELVGRLDDLTSAHAALQQRLPVMDSERVAATAAADTATSRLDQLRAIGDELARVLGPSGDGTHLRMGDDTGGISELVERAGALGGLRPHDLDAITRWLDAVTSSTAPVRSDAQDLANEIEEIETAWQRAASLGIEGSAEVAALVAERAKVAENHDLLVGLSESGLLGDTAKVQIDAAHVAVVRAGKADEQEALVGEAAVLSRYGFDSYLEYTIATSTRSVGQALDAKVAELTSLVERLDADLVAARDAAATNLNRLANEREPVQERVTAYLGFRPDGSSLDQLRKVPEVPVELTRLTVTVDDAVEGAQKEVVRYRETVKDLDDERESIGSRSGEVLDQRSTVESRISELDVILTRATTEADVLSARLQRVDAALISTTDVIGAVEAEIARLGDASTDGYTSSDIAPVVDALVARIEPSGSTNNPVLLRDAFAAFDDDDAMVALEVLVTRADLCQLVYLTDDHRICNWARTLDPTVGRFVSVAGARWSPRRLGRRVLGRRT